MARTYGSQSMVGDLQTVIVKRPHDTFGNADPAVWHYASAIDLAAAQREHDDFVATLNEAGCEVVYHDDPCEGLSDAIFTHDPVIVTDEGAILLNMGKPLRAGEPAAIGRTLEKMNVPIHFRMTGDATAEGGDLLWVDPKTLAVGIGFRTNQAGFDQLRAAIDPSVELVPVQLPYWTGPEACLHLMSFISIVDHDLAAIYAPLMPVPFWKMLRDRGFRYVEVPEEEWLTMGPNVLAIAPGKCLMLKDNPITIQRLRDAGCEVLTYTGNEISLKAEGAATCLTRPVLRSY